MKTYQVETGARCMDNSDHLNLLPCLHIVAFPTPQSVRMLETTSPFCIYYISHQ